jgi:succinyl-CoA:acetate CoA-transferase
MGAGEGSGGAPGGERIAGGLQVVDPAEAAAEVGPEETLLVSGFGGVGYPKAVPETLAADGREKALTVVSGGGVGDEIDTHLVESGAMVQRYPFQTKPASRGAINAGTVAFHDRHISRVADELRYGGLVDADTAIVEAVSVGEDWLVPSTSIGNTPAFVEAADRLIVEVNAAQPRSLSAVHDVYTRERPPEREPIPLTDPAGRIGSPEIGFAPSKLIAVVETDRADDPYTFREPTAVDRDIAAHLASFLSAEIERNPLFGTRVPLQFGVGSTGNALLEALSEVEFGGREVVYFGEVIQDGLLDMLDAGALVGASATSLALSSAGQERFFESIDRYAEDVVLRPADVSNAPALIDRFGVVGVNSAVEVDIYGNANATHVGGTHVVNGIGGGGDFNRNCPLGIVALPSTAADGSVSRVVPMVPHVDHTEHDHSVVVTEHGVADLRGLSPRERADSLVEVADPTFREGLCEYRKRAERGGGNVPHDLETAFSWHVEWGE